MNYFELGGKVESCTRNQHTLFRPDAQVLIFQLWIGWFRWIVPTRWTHISTAWAARPDMKVGASGGFLWGIPGIRHAMACGMPWLPLR